MDSALLRKGVTEERPSDVSARHIPGAPAVPLRTGSCSSRPGMAGERFGGLHRFRQGRPGVDGFGLRRALDLKRVHDPLRCEP